jgi:hypothetical protein
LVEEVEAEEVEEVEVEEEAIKQIATINKEKKVRQIIQRRRINNQLSS